MSTRRSSLARVPSNLALQAAAGSQPPRKRFRRSGPWYVPSLSGPSAGVQEIPAGVQETPASVQEIPLTAEIIDTIVQRVTDAVIQRLASGSSTDNYSAIYQYCNSRLSSSRHSARGPRWGPTQFNTTSSSCWPSYHSSTSTRSITGSILFIPIC